MFDKCVLEGVEIPSVFRTGVLRQDTSSSISRLISEIDKIHDEQSVQSDFKNETSVDSAQDFEEMPKKRKLK